MIGSFIIGVLISVALYEYIKRFGSLTILNRVLCAVLFLLMSYSASIFVSKTDYILFVIFGISSGLILSILYSKVFVGSKVYLALTREIINNSFESDGEDFMTTKKGKIITIVVAILVVYAVISTACILKLNQKINSMVVITDELREEITR